MRSIRDLPSATPARTVAAMRCQPHPRAPAPATSAPALVPATASIGIPAPGGPGRRRSAGHPGSRTAAAQDEDDGLVAQQSADPGGVLGPGTTQVIVAIDAPTTRPRRRARRIAAQVPVREHQVHPGADGVL